MKNTKGVATNSVRSIRSSGINEVAAKKSDMMVGQEATTSIAKFSSN